MAKTTPKPKTKPKAADGPPKFTGEERVVVLLGSEPFLLSDYTRQLREALGKASGAEVDTLHFDGARATLAEVFDELRSVGLMMQYKLVVIDPAEEFVKSNRAALERYADRPEPTATLLLRAGTWYKGNLDKAIEKVGLIHTCAQPTMVQAQAWAIHRAKSFHQFTIEPAAAKLLVDRIGADLGRLDGELSKLAAGAPQGKAVTAELVSALVGRGSDDEYAWGRMQEAMTSGQADMALEAVYELTELARVDAVPLLRAASDLAIKLSQAAQMLREGTSEFEICKQLRIWPRERQTSFIELARKHGTAGAARLAARIVEMDRRSKSGFGDSRRALEQFCVLLTASPR